MSQLDDEKTRSITLPRTAGTVVCLAIDTINAPRGAHVQYMLTLPPLNAAQLPDGATMRYDILVSRNADLSEPVILAGSDLFGLTQMGASGKGGVANGFPFRLSNTAPRYLGFRATSSSAANASAATAVLTRTKY